MKSDRILIAITIAAAFLATIIIAAPIPEQKEALAQNTTMMANQVMQNQTSTNQTQLEEGRVGEQIGGTGVDNVAATTTATATTSNNFLQYENSTYGIKIQYPDNWQTKPANGILGEIVFFLPRGVNQTRDQVELDISVIPSRNMSLDPLAQRLFEIYKTILPSLEIIESTQITFHGNPALMVLVNSTNPISGIVKSINIFTIKYGNLYLISYSAKPEIYSAYLPIANKMIDSFQIIKTSTGYNNNLTKNITTPGNVTGNNNTMTTTTPSSSSTSNFLTYENSTYGIRVQYPSDWELEEKDYYAGDGVTDIIQLFSPVQGRIDDYAEQFWVSKESNPVENITLAEYADKVIDYYNATVADFNLVELTTNNVTLSGFPAYKLVFTQSIEVVDNSVKAMEVGTITPKKEAYFITYFGEEQYSKYLPTIQKMIDSFEIVSDTAIGEESMERPLPTESFSSSQIRNNIITSDTNLSQVYEDPQGLFTLKYPHSWKTTHKTGERSGMPILELTTPRGVSNIDIGLIEDEDFPLDPQDFESAFETNPRILKDMLPNIPIIKSDFGVYNIDGQKAGSVLYTLPLSSFGIPELEGLNGNVKGLQVMVPLSDRTGRILLVTFATAENLFEKYLPIAESVINSIKINDWKPPE